MRIISKVSIYTSSSQRRFILRCIQKLSRHEKFGHFVTLFDFVPLSFHSTFSSKELNDAFSTVKRRFLDEKKIDTINKTCWKQGGNLYLNYRLILRLNRRSSRNPTSSPSISLFLMIPLEAPRLCRKGQTTK